jgi:hypothetical protein
MKTLALRALVLTTVIALGAVVPATAGISRPAIVISCGSLHPIVTGDGQASCTHGPDPAPPGVDPSVPQPLASSEPTFTTAAGTSAAPVPCYGDGTSGKRVQALYVHPADRPNRAAEVVPLIRGWAADVDAVFTVSAAASGAVRHVRFVTGPDCALDVAQATVSARGDDTIEATVAELAAQGYSRSDRKYLVWMDSTVLCGIANYYLDDRPDAGNVNNGSSRVSGTVARVDSGCWGLATRGQSVETHELVHTLGGVQPTAPHATSMGHCSDESDRMCYDDGSPAYAEVLQCPAEQEGFLDCGDDDYFHPSPPANSYLASHWDTARSEFLAATLPAPPPPGTVTRLAGQDRIATALATSKDTFTKAGSASAAVLANARTFADALTGVPLAARTGGPLLLTDADQLDGRVADELRRVLRPDATVYLLGGTAALSDHIADQLGAAGMPVVRYGGANRFETATMIAEQGLGSPEVVLEVTGLSFPDALAGGAAAAEVDAAILLTDGETQSLPTARYLALHPGARRYALGGPAASADPTARSLVGSDRYATAVLVAREFFAKPSVVGLASGLRFPDALAGGANIAAHSGPMLLATPGAPLPQPLVDYIRAATIDHALLYGGSLVLSDQVAYAIARLAEGP